MTDAPAIVVGGGIGGLSAAIALRRAGIQAEVWERAPEMREVGAGIGLWPNATRQDWVARTVAPMPASSVASSTGFWM